VDHVAGILIGGSNHALLLFVRHVAARYLGEIGGQDVGQKPQLADLSARERQREPLFGPSQRKQFFIARHCSTGFSGSPGNILRQRLQDAEIVGRISQQNRPQRAPGSRRPAQPF
jgi:hypothetical protein